MEPERAASDKRNNFLKSSDAVLREVPYHFALALLLMPRHSSSSHFMEIVFLGDATKGKGR